MKTQETKIWLKWYAKAPEGYSNTGVYSESTDSYLWIKAEGRA